jgi:hypothetical protein
MRPSPLYGLDGIFGLLKEFRRSQSGLGDPLQMVGTEHGSRDRSAQRHCEQPPLGGTRHQRMPGPESTRRLGHELRDQRSAEKKQQRHIAPMPKRPDQEDAQQQHPKRLLPAVQKCHRHGKADDIPDIDSAPGVLPRNRLPFMECLDHEAVPQRGVDLAMQPKAVRIEQGGGGGGLIYAPTSQQWELDVLGNWLSLATEADAGGVYQALESREHNAANELTQRTFDALAPPAPLEFDEAGNLILQRLPFTSTDVTYVHDGWNRLIEVRYNNALRATFSYNALHQRVAKSADTTLNGTIDQRRVMFYSANWQLLEEHIDDDYSVGSGGGSFTPDRKTQYFWGARGMDDIILRRVNANLPRAASLLRPGIGPLADARPRGVMTDSSIWIHCDNGPSLANSMYRLARWSSPIMDRNCTRLRAATMVSRALSPRKRRRSLRLEISNSSA